MPEISKGGAEMVRSVKRSEGETTGRFSVGDAGQHENCPETLQVPRSDRSPAFTKNQRRDQSRQQILPSVDRSRKDR